MSNLLNKASIIITPTGYNTSEILAIKPSNGDGDLDFSRASTATRTNALQTIENVSINVPRIDYTGGVGHILLEPQSTNYNLNSSDYTASSWFTLSVNVDTTNLAVSPSGNLDAQKVTRIPGTYSLIRQGNRNTRSVFVKNIDAENFYLRTDYNQVGTQWAYYNFNSKTVSNSALKVDYYANDWIRLSTENSHPQYKQFGIGQTEAGVIDDNKSVYIWGAQNEDGIVTSYIPTVGSSVTRLGETLTNSGNADLFNDTEGTLYFETAALTDEGTGERKISINDGTDDNQVTIYYHPSITNRVVPRIFAGGSSVWAGDINIDTVYGRTNSQFNKFAIRYSSNGIQFFFNGVLARTTTSVPNFTNPLNTLSFDNGQGGSPFYGKTKCVAVFREALTDVQLQCLTS